MFLHSHHAKSKSDRADILKRFNDELDELDALHRYQTRSIDRDYDKWTEEYFEQLQRPEDVDPGDAHYYAAQKLGTEPSQALSHIGLMTIVRAVALSEVTLAHLAATLWKNPEVMVFPDGKTWYNSWAQAFYQGVPASGFNINSNGFDVLQDIRNIYAHGYGIAGTDERLKDLARKAWNAFSREPATKKEKELGYDGDAVFFSGALERDHNGVPRKTFGGVPLADMTPLMTHRAIERIREVIAAAARSLESGRNDDYESSRYMQIVQEYWDSKKAK